MIVLHRSNKNSEFEESNTSKKLQSIIQEVNRKDNQESDGDEVSTGSSKILPPEEFEVWIKRFPNILRSIVKTITTQKQ
ncbi:uncharacterized protein OCT59_015014 [Rhizophagus irregularis]|uniref:uncharacterized protein n=1 Tax=Rhizophagus irregularis TaxID=588596 RepID=UPI00332E0C9F|nr:hypothetical protein OCT59_015014 [Rhizophagus irregularis]